MSKWNRTVLTTIGVLATAFLAGAVAPLGWHLAGSAPANYDTGVDQSSVYNGRPSGFLKAKADLNGFGTLMQQFAPDQYIGKRVRFSAFVKSDAVSRWAGLWMRVDGKSQTPLAFDNMQNRSIKGITGWQSYDVVLDVPQGATGIALGILLDGPGQVWINSASVTVVGTEVPVTSSKKPLDDAPRNLGFDQ